MFTFGLFSTHMPYVVMVVFYVFYFLFSSPTFKNITETNVDQDIPDSEILQTHPEKQQGQDVYFFADYSSNENTFRHQGPQAFTLFYSPPEVIPEKDGYCYSILSRPPPFIS